MFGLNVLTKLIADVKMIEAELQTNGIFQKIASDVVVAEAEWQSPAVKALFADLEALVNK